MTSKKLYNFFFFALAIFPLCILILCYFRNGTDCTYTLSTIYTHLGIDFTDNVIFEVVWGIFGEGGTFPLITESACLTPFIWFICVYLVKLAVDVILFIPCVCEKFMNNFSKETSK